MGEHLVPEHYYWKTKAVRRIFEGSRGGMWWQIGSAVQETRYGDSGGASPERIR
jgi:hypothetical protein